MISTPGNLSMEDWQVMKEIIAMLLSGLVTPDRRPRDQGPPDGVSR
jgi:hypothetical protein